MAEQVIDILDSRFRGMKGQVEVIDVYTLMTWERYMGGTQGWFNLPQGEEALAMKAMSTRSCTRTGRRRRPGPAAAASSGR